MMELCTIERHAVGSNPGPSGRANLMHVPSDISLFTRRPSKFAKPRNKKQRKANNSCIETLRHALCIAYYKQ